MNEIITRLISLPPRVKGFVALDPESDYNIYLNENLSSEEQKKSYLHEIEHINRNHLSNIIAVDETEQETH